MKNELYDTRNVEHVIPDFLFYIEAENKLEKLHLTFDIFLF